MGQFLSLGIGLKIFMMGSRKIFSLKDGWKIFTIGGQKFLQGV